MFSLYNLPHQQEDEKTILILRRHWFILFKIIVSHLIIIFFPIIFYLIIPEKIFNSVITSESSYAFFIFLASVFYLSIWLVFFNAFLDYYLDTWIITSERIISIEQKALFSRVVAEQKIYRVQDVTSEVHGFFETFLNFGNVHIQTAASKERFIFKQIANPDKIVKLIIGQAEESKHRHADEVE